MIDYAYIQDLLTVDYRPLIRHIDTDGSIYAVSFHVNSIVKERHLDFVKGIFAGNGLNIAYDNNREEIFVRIP